MSGFYHDTFPIETKLQHLPEGLVDWGAKLVLDLGCNTGDLGPYVLARGAAHYVGWEVNAEWAEEGRRRHPELTIHTGAAQGADLGCDVLCCLGLFHHISSADVLDILKHTTARTIVIEQPMGGPFKNYLMRPQRWYEDALRQVHCTTVTRVPYGFSYPVDRAILVGQKGPPRVA
jgi:SAM-dependent methyltransferase